MKIALALLGCVALAGTAYAQSGPPKVPTGIDVPGPTHYIQKPGDPKVIPVSCDNTRSWTIKAIADKCRSINGPGGVDVPGPTSN